MTVRGAAEVRRKQFDVVSLVAQQVRGVRQRSGRVATRRRQRPDDEDSHRLRDRSSSTSDRSISSSTLSQV